MATLKPLYSNQSADIASGLNSLANDGVATSNAVDNSTNLYQDFLLEIIIAGTAATNAFLDVRLAASENNTDFGTWESAIPLGTIDLSVSPQKAFFSLLNAIYQAPKYFKVLIKNKTGAALAATGNSIKWQGVNIQSV